MRIVIPLVAGIGNSLLAVPMVRQMKRKIPDSRVTILARTDAIAEPMRRIGDVDEVIVTGKGIGGAWRMIRESRRRKPDVYLVPFPSNRWQYSLLALTSGAKRKILHGYPVGYFRAMHFLPAERLAAQRGIHDVNQNLRLLTLLGVAPDFDETPVFPVDSHARELIAIHPGSAKTILARAKRWPPERYAQLITPLLSVLAKRRIVLLEGPDESGVCAEINSHLEHPVDVIKLTGPLSEAAEILSRAALYIGSDSGLAHLAAAVGTRAVTIFAPADPDRVCPFGNRDLVVQPPTDCAPCFMYPYESPKPKMRCREPMCITRVTVESVLAAIERALPAEKVHEVHHA